MNVSVHRNIGVGLLDNWHAAGGVVNSRVNPQGAFSQVLPVVTTSGTQDTRKENFKKKITSYIVLFFISSYFVDCKKSK